MGSLVLLALAGVAGYILLSDRAPAPLRAFVPTGSNLLLVTIDTLRADHLPAYGYRALETPTIDRLAREGIVFRNAFTPVPLTLPAHSSLMTGLLPSVHGVRDNGDYHLGPAQTLATVFATHHYRTAGFVSAWVLDRRWGIAQGFERYVDDFQVTFSDLAAMAQVQRPAGETWSQARTWLNGATGDRFFVWLHFFDPHTPYEPPEPFKAQYASRPYDGEIAYVDSVLGEAVAELERHSLLEKTVIVVVADHGEGLGDHNEDEHGLLIYDSTLRVPWIMRLPDRTGAGTKIERPVSLVDVFPTVLEMFGFGSPQPIDGTSQVASLRGQQLPSGEIYAESLYPRLRLGWSELTSVRTERYKYIRAPRRELYEYLSDPDESTNVIGQHPDVADRLDRVLTAISEVSSARTIRRPGALDPAAARALRSLGYVSGPVLEPSGIDRRLADPKDKVEVFRRFNRAQQLLEAEQSGEGVELLVRLIEDEPDMEPAHRLIRNYWIGRGEFRTAASRFLTESRRRPAEVGWLMDLGLTDKAWGRSTDAMDAFKKVLAVNPNHVEALKSMGEVLLERQSYTEALEYFDKALKGSPASEEINGRIAETYLHMGRLAEAEAVLNGVLGEQSQASNVHYLLAQIAEQRADASGAEREYRLEIAISPWDYRARFNLALLVGQRGDHREQVELLQSILTLAPQFADAHFYLAKALLDAGDSRRFDEALAEAGRGLALAPASPSAPLGHYVRADIYRLQGRAAESQREVDRGRALEKRLSDRGR